MRTINKSLCLWLMIILPFFIGPTAYAQKAVSDHGFALVNIVIKTTYGDELSLTVEVAKTSRQRAKGLMGRKKLTDSDGMLFMWPDTAIRQFWMKDTPLSLDILFFDNKGTLVHMAERQKPYSEALIPSLMPVRYVLELPGGDAKRRKIALGDYFAKVPNY